MPQCPESIQRLVDRFHQQSDQIRSPDYNETLIRIDFINPLMTELGWDIDNRQGFAEQYREVVHEDRVKVAGQTKAPDYSFRVGGVRKFFLEAKKPAVDIRNNWEPAYQLRRYAWSAKLACSLLTDFEEFAIYDARIQPKPLEKASVARREYIKYTDYPDRWDFLHGTFSKHAVLKGEFDRYCESRKGRGAQLFDDVFLGEIEEWRKALASNLARRNESLDEAGVNFAVQRIIDRILFLRIAEDRGTETVGQLQSLLNGDTVYKRLVTLFNRADERYNSGLFHFAREKDRDEAPDTLTPTLDIDDKTLKTIIKALYYPQSPYEFTVVSADILGSVYERFLGKIITLTPGHNAKIEEKPEVRKAGGVYYTPAYIVDYIVRNTVGKLLPSAPQPSPVGSASADGISPDAPKLLNTPTPTPKPGQSAGSASDQSAAPDSPAAQSAIRNRQLAIPKLKILDPACGSGSFLIGAYQYLLDWYLNQYTTTPDPAALATGRNPTLRPTPAGGWALTIAQRKRILLDHIHGVDLDAQAVEVTKLNLLLKCLEGETSQTLGFEQRLFRERALPDLGKNILCGNSLIGTDIIGTDAWNKMTDEERARINPFDYDRAFPNIMQTGGGGGFDAVIGNPPWGAWLDDGSLEYLRAHYARVIDRMVDTYIYLLDRGIRVKREVGLLGFIVPATVLNQVDATKVRRLLLASVPQVVVGLGKDIFTKKVLNTSAIVIVGGASRDAIRIGDYSRLKIEDRPIALAKTPNVDRTKWVVDANADPCCTFQLADQDKSALLSRLRTVHPPFSALLIGSIERGVSPDIAAAHVIRDADMDCDSPERDILRRSVSGPRVSRYRSPDPDQWIVYTTRNTPIAAFPRARAHLKQWESQNTCREVKEEKHPVWSLHRPRRPDIFQSPKFIGLTTAKTIEVIFDANDSLYVTDAMYVFKTREGIDHREVLAVMSSKLFLFLYRVSNVGEARVIPQVKAAKLEPLPFPDLGVADSTSRRKVTSLADSMLSLHKRLAAEPLPQRREQIQREIDATDRQIDQLVYQLYGLTTEEIDIVESATA